MNSTLWLRQLSAFGVRLTKRLQPTVINASCTGRPLHVHPQLTTARVIDGKAIAKQIKDEVKVEVAQIKEAGGRSPQLTVILVGSDPASVVYVRNKIKACVETFGKNAVVCGRSKNVGLPIAVFLHGDGDRGSLSGDATTTICHRYTPAEQLAVFTKTADIIVTAAGVPNLLTADMVKEGVAVIDVGINRIDDPDKPGKTKLVGDVDFAGVAEKASVITPVPGGVGPCTVAMLMKNTLLAYKMAANLPH
ncbi:bifunctional methylenetetrahydrofolate dehydrogenase/cyclohydrolase, mitochondrial-like [Babylonia areolata]|uniref:bifunctional methylenetetrahydrofolate dehydrogenase/cyclohydrolase, mitochondrial-like n=1 Tax=Babylonia areolata TaxID=304850 RepID=UPI003FD68BF8